MITPELKARIALTKQEFAQGGIQANKAFGVIRSELMHDIERIQNRNIARRATIPDIKFQDIVDNNVSDVMRVSLRRFGVIVIRGVFEHDNIRNWEEQLDAYLKDNKYREKLRDVQNPAGKPAEMQDKTGLVDGDGENQAEAQDASEAKYQTPLFQTPDEAIAPIFWSKPQMEMRQHPNLIATKSFLNQIWRSDPNAAKTVNLADQAIYIDRFMARNPQEYDGAMRLHIPDGGIERWMDPAFRRIYMNLFMGKFKEYDPWDASLRPLVRFASGVNNCSMFRSFLGYASWSNIESKEGTLTCIPLVKAIGYILLRNLMSDLDPRYFVGANPGEPLSVISKLYNELYAAQTTIPDLAPGDTVWWHPDVIQGIESTKRANRLSQLHFLSATPICKKNIKYLGSQWQCMNIGRSPTDFSDIQMELSFKERVTTDDISDQALPMLFPSRKRLEQWGISD